MLLQGWGRYPVIDADIRTPDSVAAAQAILRDPTTHPLIAHGMGRSYGDSALAPHVLAMRGLHWLQDFNADTGVLSCQAGATLDDILNVFVPRGWFLPVTPGTRFVSIGGAIASDVHGKNHHRHGCFSEFVQTFELLLADGSVLNCSRREHAELFRATCGGMGLTGIVLGATLQLSRIASAYMDQATSKACNLEHALELFAANASATYSVAWLDCMVSGKRLGRALLGTGEHAPQGGFDGQRTRALAIPMDLPGLALNRYTTAAFNHLYYARQRRQRRLDIVHYQSFFYPLDRILHWNRMYGSKGFVQYQCVIPHEAASGLRRLLQRIAASGQGSFLAVLKELGPANDNLLSFPRPGYTLALDFKMADGLLPLLDELDAIVLDHGGRLYLAKDARMNATTFKRCYPQWEEFQAIRERYGAVGRFASMQSRRLGLERNEVST